MPKDHCTACACLLFCGPCGGHRCYLDDCCCGVLYLLTFGFAYIGVLCDCCYLGTMVQAANLKYAGGGGGTTVVVQNNITNSNSSQSPSSYVPPQQQFNPPPDWQQGRAKGGFCSSCGAQKNDRFCGNCGRE